MKNNFKKETIINVLSSIALGGFLMYLAAGSGELASIFLVFPFLVIFLNEGWKLSLLSMLVTIGIGSFFLDPLSLAYLGLCVVSLTIFSGLALKKKKSLRTTILYAAFIKLALLIAFIVVGYYITKVNPIELMRQTMYASIEEVSKTLTDSLDVSPAEIEKMLQMARDTVDNGIEILPAIFFIISYFEVAVNILLGLKIAQKSGENLGYNKKLNEYNPRYELRLASSIVAVACVVIYMLGLEFSSLVISNLIAIVSFFYFLDGFLLSDYIYAKSGRKFVRVFIPILIILVFRSFILYVIIGIFDVIFNMRERMMANAKK